jgi:gas vesicle protein
MSRAIRLLAGLFFGAFFAAGLVLLFAPQSGAETRRLIRERVEQILAEGRQASQTRRLELMAQFQSLKQPSHKV